MNHSAEDLYALPDDGYQRELQAGFLVSEPPAGGRHGDTALALGSALRRHVREHRLVWVVDPEMKTVAVYRTLLSPRFFGPEDTLDGEDVVPGFALPVAEIFEE